MGGGRSIHREHHSKRLSSRFLRIFAQSAQEGSAEIDTEWETDKAVQH